MTSIGKAAVFEAALEKDRAQVDARLGELLDRVARGPAVIEEAVRYMVLDAGKRLRPVLCLWAHDALEGAARDACLDVGCAIECLHTYSLIHDDLPCMDDDDMRRGKPSCHRKYGEAVAVLTGDALLTVCFEILGSVPRRHGVAPETGIETVGVVSGAAGTMGLIGGQILDIANAGRETDLDHVNEIHKMKTAVLIAASMECGAIMAGAEIADRERIRRSGELAGRAFQIIDDVLDVEADGATLGKTPGKDARAGKATYPSIVGVDAARLEARELVRSAKEGFCGNPPAELLCSLLDFMVERGR